jgi:hypothetical protein
MKLDKDPFPMNMNMVELNGKKALVQQSLAESTKGKTVAKDDQAKMSEGWPMEKELEDQATKVPKGHLQHPHGEVQRIQG